MGPPTERKRDAEWIRCVQLVGPWGARARVTRDRIAVLPIAGSDRVSWYETVLYPKTRSDAGGVKNARKIQVALGGDGYPIATRVSLFGIARRLCLSECHRL